MTRRYRARAAIASSVFAALALAGCGSDHVARQPRLSEWHPPVDMLLRYDFNRDGTISRAELEKGLREDFAKADTNHDGRLGEDEVRAVNEQRWAVDASAASPLVDWNHDGYVDFDEFSATSRSLFAQMDTNADGVLSPQELHPLPPPQPRKARKAGSRGGRGGAEQDGGGPDGDND